MSEAMGKILGMAMAYGVSSLGLFLAYANYRRRIVGAERVMTSRAWMVIAVVALAVAAAVAVVGRLAAPPGPAAEVPAAEAVAAEAPATETPDVAMAAARGAERDRWPLVGILIPAAIFLFATWVTAALHRHFATRGHGPGAAGDAGDGGG